MNGTLLGTLARGFAHRLSRRRFLGMAALAALPATFGWARAQSDASALVQRFYELVDAYQYAQAWDLLGAKWHSQQSLDNFTRGYSDTAFVQCETTGETANGATTRVGVNLLAWHNDGTMVAYTGHYDVGMENGQPTILAGSNVLAPVPAHTPPLCKIADLSLAFGMWQGAAGSTISSVVATNRSDTVCVLGGSPRITLTDTAGDVLVSTSAEGSAPVAIGLKPGLAAQAPLRFSNWCEATGNPASVRAQVPGDTASGDVSFAQNGIAYPPCNGPGQPAFMEIKGWTSQFG